MKIYPITVFEKIDNEKLTNLPTFGDRRCIGFFDNVEEAIYQLSLHGKKIRDKMYNYCIIEEISDGLYKSNGNRYLYKWSDKEQRYIQIDEPKEIHMVSNFGIG